MNTESITAAINAAIADESRLDEPYHRGRVHALRFVLDLIVDDNLSVAAEKSSPATAKNAARNPGVDR